VSSDIRTRLIVVALVLLAGRLVTGQREPHSTALLQPLSAFPFDVDGWRGRQGAAFDADTIKVLGADEYLNRIYEHPATAVASLYIGYYGSQQQGDAIHSPQNCLPGSGWVPVSRIRTTLSVGDRDVPVNRYIIEKRGERQLVLYWFQGRGRVVAGEYVNKAYLLHDALRLGRTDGALVRIITPILGSETAADGAARTFARAVLPHLPRWLP
jgi:EpsI family protein